MSMSTELEFRPVEVTMTRVETWQAAAYRDKLVKVNKRLAKMGAPAATLTFGPKRTVEARDEMTGLKRTWDEYETMTVHGVEARHAGWTGVASLDHSIGGDEAFVTAFPGHEGELPASFRTRGPVCDHCQITTKTRRLTIVFVNEQGEYRQVGRQCVQEYIGVDPQLVLWLGRNAFATDDEDAEPRCSMGRYTPSPAEFLACAAEATRVNGFVPSSHTDRWTTKGQAVDLVFGRLKSDEMRKEFPDFDAKRGEALAADVMAWVAEQDDSSDFMANAKVACAAPRTSDRTYGILASLPHVYAKAVERQMEQAVKAKASENAGYLGTVGGKVAVEEATVTFHQTSPGYAYNSPDVHRVNFLTPEGHRLTVYGSSQSLVMLDVGDKVSLTAKVKDHENHETYGMRTVLWHVKAERLDADEDRDRCPGHGGDQDDATVSYCNGSCQMAGVP